MKWKWILIALFILTGCNKENAPDCFQSIGSTDTKEIFLTEEFNELEVFDNIHVHLTNDTSIDEYVVLTGGDNLLPEIDFSVSEGKLIIKNENTCNWVRSKHHFTVLINSHRLTRLFNWGSEGVSIDLIEAEEFTFEQESSLADNIISYQGTDLTVNMHSGAGTVVVSGASPYAEFYCDGFSFLSAKEFSVDHLSCNNSGDNDMFVSPLNFLFGYIGGSGNIYYNTPTIDTDIHLFGEGEVIYNDF